MRALFKAGRIVTMTVLFILLALSIQSGYSVWAGAVVLLASPVAMALTALLFEPAGRLRQVFDLKTQSWTLLFGDVFGLTTVVAALAVAWRNMPVESWGTSWWWAAVSYIAGFLLGKILHNTETKAYKAKGASELLASPTKQVHDFLTFPVCSGGIICGGVPVVVQVWVDSTLLWPVIFALGGMVVWLIMVVRDLIVKFDPYKLHPSTWKWK